MRTIVRLAALLTLGVLPCCTWAQEGQAPPTGQRSPVRLLPGYKIELRYGFEGNVGGRIWKTDGLSIDFYTGINNPRAIDSIKVKDVRWKADHVVGGLHIILVYGTSDRVAISIPNVAADFTAKVRNQQDLTEMLLMVLTFDTQHGYPVDPSTTATSQEKPK